MTDSQLPTPQRGQVWRSKVGDSTYEVLDDRRIQSGWAVLATVDGGRFVSNRNLHNGNYEPPRPEIPTYWVNVYANRASDPTRDARIADVGAVPGRICRVPLVPDWDSAVYDEEQR